MGITRKAIVVKSTGSRCEIRFSDDGEIVDCRVPGKFRIKGLRSTNPVAVGDEVAVSKDQRGEWRVEEIAERRNYLVRKSVNLSHHKHVIAANIDQAVLVVTLTQPKTSCGFMDRFLVSCEAYGIPAIVVFNKTDLYETDLMDEVAYLEVVYKSAGYQTLQTSVETRQGLDALAGLLRDKVSLLGGHSGVGKSSLINAIDPLVNLKTGDISTTHQKGQHTTTFAQMVFLPNNGGAVVDSPGIKGFGLIDMDKEEISDYFPEFFAIKSNCQFHNCTHLNEPKCAVKSALENHELPISRYESYLSMLEDDENHYRS
ncbi:MAG: ribosome small subunit-dependent GTPase A [Cryomorphaceae bacterium]|nr:ribosome small subunit-dependent GTPase A [Cryomorphaceae bacterium]